ncbi:DUF3889 domain-containing protein [Paenibacillus sp. YAF4_2]|uniref:DUF3889 domain-containing protein n=1 Tax=Paenibacillus sp. YAF4_2 TaxID=3233085 RepID=UPI003F9BE990
MRSLRQPLIYMILVTIFVMAAPSMAHAEPAYAKYGRIAMQETANRFPEADIIDYKYEGRFPSGTTDAEERFVLWLRGAGSEFGVRVRIRVVSDTGDVRDVQVEEIRQ